MSLGINTNQWGIESLKFAGFLDLGAASNPTQSGIINVIGDDECPMIDKIYRGDFFYLFLNIAQPYQMRTMLNFLIYCVKHET